jgi:REP element-mobilizing transposase RayT
MPRRNRDCPQGLAVHVIQRGNNRQICFVEEADIKAYANWLCEGAEKYSVAVHAWVFMTNHVHLLMTPSDSRGVSACMQLLGRHYVRYFNYRYQRTGTLFEWWMIRLTTYGPAIAPTLSGSSPGCGTHTRSTLHWDKPVNRDSRPTASCSPIT